MISLHVSRRMKKRAKSVSVDILCRRYIVSFTKMVSKIRTFEGKYLQYFSFANHLWSRKKMTKHRTSSRIVLFLGLDGWTASKVWLSMDAYFMYCVVRIDNTEAGRSGLGPRRCNCESEHEVNLSVDRAETVWGKLASAHRPLARSVSRSHRFVHVPVLWLHAPWENRKKTDFGATRTNFHLDASATTIS